MERRDDFPAPAPLVWPEGRKANPVVLGWPKGRRPSYSVTVWLEENGTEFECVSFEVTSLRPGVSIGTGVVRDLPVASLIRDAVRQLIGERLAGADDAVEDSIEVARAADYLFSKDPSKEEHRRAAKAARARAAHWAELRDQAAKQLDRASGEGKGRRYPPGHLEQVAEIVREARRRKEPAQAAVMQVFDLKRSAAANQIARAKARGLLDSEEES